MRLLVRQGQPAMSSCPDGVLHVLEECASRALLRLDALHWPVLIGARGIAHLPREGDLATPAGLLRPLCVFYRHDRLARPRTSLPVRALHPQDGWCDAPGHALYNRFVRHPVAARAEHLWREDHAYDLLVVLDFNVHPRSQGRSSAIFLHLMHDDGRPTAGCLAMQQHHLRQLLGCWRPGDVIHVL